jgi:pimeloyl-ACP methyl ester carboxylesterase
VNLVHLQSRRAEHARTCGTVTSTHYRAEDICRPKGVHIHDRRSLVSTPARRRPHASNSRGLVAPVSRQRVFLIHGIDSDRDTFDQVRPELEAAFDVDVCEYAGFSGWFGFGALLSLACDRKRLAIAVWLAFISIAGFVWSRAFASHGSGRPIMYVSGALLGVAVAIGGSGWYRRERSRTAAARRVREQISAASAKQPLGCSPHVIAHSFGAYLLMQYAHEPPVDLRFDTAILLSAPLQRDLDFAPHLRPLPGGSARFRAIHHEVGRSDKDVRLVQRLAKYEGATFGDAGAGGFAPSPYLHVLHDPLDYCPQCGPMSPPVASGLVHESHFPRREHDVLRSGLCARDYWVPVLLNIYPEEFRHLRKLATRIEAHRLEARGSSAGQHWMIGSPVTSSVALTLEMANDPLRCFRRKSLLEALLHSLAGRAGAPDLRFYRTMEDLLTQWARVMITARLDAQGQTLPFAGTRIGTYIDPREAVREAVSRVSGVA